MCGFHSMCKISKDSFSDCFLYFGGADYIWSIRNFDPSSEKNSSLSFCSFGLVLKRLLLFSLSSLFTLYVNCSFSDNLLVLTVGVFL